MPHPRKELHEICARRCRARYASGLIVDLSHRWVGLRGDGGIIHYGHDRGRHRAPEMRVPFVRLGDDAGGESKGLGRLCVVVIMHSAFVEALHASFAQFAPP